jgi:hypothetical protein
MACTKIDQYQTALANGYSPGQAESLASWPLKNFMVFMSTMVRGDCGKRVWVYVDGSWEVERKR